MDLKAQRKFDFWEPQVPDYKIVPFLDLLLKESFRGFCAQFKAEHNSSRPVLITSSVVRVTKNQKKSLATDGRNSCGNPPINIFRIGIG